MQSNPIQQRIELICDKWEDAKKNARARIVQIRCQPDESDMVDTFYTYMVGVDSPIIDIAFHFESVCKDPKQFSISLLNELEEYITIWNDSRKDERIEFVPVNWTADRSIQDAKNPAALFVNNFNSLARALNLPPGIFTVAILKKTGSKEFIAWLKDALGANIDGSVRYLVHDRTDIPAYDEIKMTPYASAFETIPLNLNMPKAMEQVAAMGDPNDPATAYRQHFMKMMNEMAAANENRAERAAQECLAIATKNISRDPYWITQVVVIYIALANDKIRYRKKEETLDYADKAVDTAIASKTYFENDIASLLLAQAVMFRGSVYYVQDKRREAFTDFNLAFELYQQQYKIRIAKK